MPLLKRKPRKLITCTEAAKRMGYKSSMTVKRKIQAGIFRGVKMSDGPTTPWFLFEAEVEAYIQDRLSKAY